MKTKFFLFNFLIIISISFVSCDKTEVPPDDPPPPVVTYCDCNRTTYPMTVVVSSAPTMVFVRLKPGSYGANNVYFYELDSTATGYFYKGTQTAIETKIATKNWTPRAGYIWAAGRAGLDGYDPFTPVVANELIYPYLPWTPGVERWESNNGIYNLNTCPGSNHNNYWMAYCGGLDGKHQLDHLAPQLQADHWYLARMVMGYSVNNVFSFTSECYQRVFKFKRGTYAK